MTRRRFNESERAALYLAADGKCEMCGTELEPGWHADHVIPYSRHGKTHVLNGQALCPPCNLKKGNRMARPLREWQEETLNQYRRAVNPQRFLIAAFPGMGKTEAASAILEHTGRFGIILVPQVDSLSSWRRTLHGRGICPAQKVSKSGVSRICASCGKPVRAAVMTYDFAAANADVVAQLYRRQGSCLLVCDEVHHLRSERAWAAPLVAARPFIDAVLSLSATPFRTDEEPVPFVHTEGPWTRQLAPLPDYCVAEYGYGRALTMKPPPVARAVFERYDADVTWLESDIGGEVEKTATLSGDNPKEIARKARRYAVDARGNWLPSVLRQANEQLNALRGTDRRAGGLVVCRDTDHAIATADLLVRETTDPVAVYTQDYATQRHRVGNGLRDEEGRRRGHESGNVLDAYREGDTPWIVTVRKVSEGVDVPRLRVLVYATVTRTRLFFIQVLGRVIRIVPDLPKEVDQTAWVYIPDDQEMRSFAAEIENGIADAEIRADDEEEERERGEEQLALWRERSERTAADRFVSAEPEYSGLTASGEAHDPELAVLARDLGGEPHSTLAMLRKLRDRGLLNLSANEAHQQEANVPVDPVEVLGEKIREKNAAANSWASLRLRAGEFPNYTEAIKACHNELGETFKVWSDNEDVTVEQVEKAIKYAREQIRRLRRG